MNQRFALCRHNFTAKQILLFTLFGESLVITWAITGIFAFDISHKNYFGEINQGGVITYVSCLQLLITAILSGKIFKLVKIPPSVSLKSTQQLNKSSFFWLTICIGLVFLALDDALGIHESMDFWLHDWFNIQQTEITDLADDIIVGGYLVLFLIYVAFKWQAIKIFQQSFIFFKLGCILTAIMVILDIASNNKLFVSMITDNVALMSAIQDWLEIIEDSAKIFAEGMFFVGVYKCWQIAKKARNQISG